MNNNPNVQNFTHQPEQTPPPHPANQKYCKHCGQLIDVDCVVCPKCGKQVEELRRADAPIVINNTNTNNVSAYATARAAVGGYGRPKNKWVALALCLLTVCGHKFYEGKFGMGIIYLFTAGLFGIGWIMDIIALLMKPRIYYV